MPPFERRLPLRLGSGLGHFRILTDNYGHFSSRQFLGAPTRQARPLQPSSSSTLLIDAIYKYSSALLHSTINLLLLCLCPPSSATLTLYAPLTALGYAISIYLIIMFIKKDLRKIPKILNHAVVEADTDSDDDDDDDAVDAAPNV